uniref:7-cyano-7-deazaguanine synthase QueC n=1 Tax=Orrella sp. TaxID=1921583 RepID=UPI0040482E9F
MKRAVCLLSGGLDSTTSLAIAQEQGFEVYALSFRYGQRHTIELKKATDFALARGVKQHVTLDIDLRRFGGSALTDDIAIPKTGVEATIGHDIPVTYVPARNTIFLSFAMGWAEVLGARDVFVGVNAQDYSGYPDCRPAFLEAFENLAQVATKVGVTESGQALKIHAPLIAMSKADIVQRGIALGIDFGETSSCYDPDDQGKPCLQCDACVLRAKGFRQAGVADPLLTKFGLSS